jgi:putative ABC transport system permease protein
MLLPSERTVTVEYGPEEHKAQLGGEEFTPFVMGITPDVLEARRLVVARGRAFTADEVRLQRRVLLVGATVLEGEVDPGDSLRIEGVPFLVVGVLAEKPDMGPGGRFSWNNRLLMPAATYRLQFDPSGDPGRIVVRVTPPADYLGPIKDFVLGARDLMDVVLARGKTVKSWRLEGMSDDSSTEALIFRTIEALLYLTTVFSMIVGGINIMNIMLVTVAERTREIGTRRALGATQGDILRQFLAETVMVTLLGSFIGLIGAAAIVVVGSLAMDAYVVEWPIRFIPWSITGGVGFSGAIGLLFGMFPAWRASRLDPVEALRYE